MIISGIYQGEKNNYGTTSKIARAGQQCSLVSVDINLPSKVANITENIIPATEPWQVANEFIALESAHQGLFKARFLQIFIANKRYRGNRNSDH